MHLGELALVSIYPGEGGFCVSFRKKLKMEDIGLLVALVFYVIVGIICFAVLAISDFRLIHISIIGILSLIAAYGLLKSRVWTLWIVVALFFIATTFSVYMLYSAFQKDLLLDVSVIAYLVLTWVFTAYTAAKREALES